MRNGNSSHEDSGFAQTGVPVAPAPAPDFVAPRSDCARCFYNDDFEQNRACGNCFDISAAILLAVAVSLLVVLWIIVTQIYV